MTWQSRGKTPPFDAKRGITCLSFLEQCILFFMSSNRSTDALHNKTGLGAGIPRYEQIKRHLRHDIDSGLLPPGQMLPSQGELAAKYGVSDITIRRALQDLARSGVLQRIAGVGTFVREERKLPRIALLLLGFDQVEKWRARSKIFGDLMAGIGEIAWESWSVFSVVRLNDVEAARNFIKEQTAQHLLDGLLIKSRDGTVLPELVAGLTIPYVTIRTTGPGVLNSALGDEFGEAQQLTRHLITQGYRRIAFIGPPIEDLFQRRYGGYVASLRGAHLPLDESLILRAEDYAIEHAGLWVDRLLGASGSLAAPGATRFDAIFCGMGTHVASRMIAELAERGLRVPEDLGFVMHDPDDSGELFEPPVTSAGCSNFDLGRAGAHLLDSLLKNQVSATSQLILPTHVVIRASTPGPMHNSPLASTRFTIAAQDHKKQNHGKQIQN